MALKRIHFCTFILCAVFILPLTACNPFSENTDYTIMGLDDKKPLQDYAETILNDRLKNEIETKKDTPEFTTAEAYREDLIQGDIVEAMKAKGYYDTTVTYIDDETAPLKGTYTIKTGEQYVINDIMISPNTFSDFMAPLISTGDPLIAENVLETQNTLYKNIQKDKCYFDLKIKHAVILNKDSKTAELSYDVEIGPQVQLGRVTFKGQDKVKEKHLQKRVPWVKGDCYRTEKIEALKTELLSTGLFSRVNAITPSNVSEGADVPIIIELKERPHRSVKAGLSYYTYEGAGTELSWTHRNFLGSAEKLEAILKVNRIKQNLDVNLTKPFFIRNDQELSLTSSIFAEDNEAYEEQGVKAGASIKRQFSRSFSGRAGVEYSLSEITDQGVKEQYGLFSTPISALYDKRNDILNPERGYSLSAAFEPFFDTLGESDPFTKLQAGARAYYDFETDGKFIFATRFDVGSLVGSGTLNIPANERFYAGGGGSVRGYGYQEVGPFDAFGEPTGGRSFTTGSTELRYKFKPDFGVVGFIDGGSVSDSIQPDFDNLSFGVGVGARYYTSFGPLRLDVAVPLDKTENVDNSFQVYVSIGQAF